MSSEHRGHEHDAGAGHGERRTRLVVALTTVMMVVEIGGGVAFGSMALLADGWHMAGHAAALSITLLAYAMARRFANHPRLPHGTRKINSLGGFASGVALLLVAVQMAWESVQRMWAPVAIHFDEAIGVAVVGLVVNVVSALLLAQGHDGEHGHGEGHGQDDGHGHRHGHQDHNLRAAYLHVLADSLTSVLAILGLLGAKRFGLMWADAAVGVVGAAVILHWTWGLLRASGAVLLDVLPDGPSDRAHSHGGAEHHQEVEG